MNPPLSFGLAFGRGKRFISAFPVGSIWLAGMMPPGIANLYAFGVFQPRGGAGPLITAGAGLLAEMVELQGHMSEPLADVLARFRKPDARMLVGVNETMREIRRGRRALALIARMAKWRGTWVEPAEPVAVAA